MSEKRLLTIAELSIILNVPVSTIYYWVHRKKVPYLKIGKHLRFDEKSVLKHFESLHVAQNNLSQLVDSLKTQEPKEE